MYGKIVKYRGYKIWINCLPSTRDDELERRAKVKLERYLNGEIDSLN
jgi:hypothetical protein